MRELWRTLAPFGMAHVPITIVLTALLVGCSDSHPPTAVEQARNSGEVHKPSGSTVLKGAGATFPSLLYKRWFSTYHDNHPRTYISYDAVGSSEGIRRFLGNGVSPEELVEFGASDAALSDAQIAQAGKDVLMLPATAGCVVLAYNLPGFTGEVRLSRKAYAGIFLGKITNWDDLQIAQSNPGTKLPKLTIATVVRQDGSGTTFAFTQNLDAINADWRNRFGSATSVNWPGNAMRAKGNEGVAGLIENSTGAIGYVGYEFARRLGLNFASLENKEGNYVRPSEQSCAKALATAEMPDDLRVFVPDPSGADSYPIATFSWVLLRKTYLNKQTADAVHELFQWSLEDGQHFAPDLGYVPLPPEVAKKALVALNSIGPRS